MKKTMFFAAFLLLFACFFCFSAGPVQLQPLSGGVLDVAYNYTSVGFRHAIATESGVSLYFNNNLEKSFPGYYRPALAGPYLAMAAMDGRSVIVIDLENGREPKVYQTNAAPGYVEDMRLYYDGIAYGAFTVARGGKIGSGVFCLSGKPFGYIFVPGVKHADPYWDGNVMRVACQFKTGSIYTIGLAVISGNELLLPQAYPTAGIFQRPLVYFEKGIPIVFGYKKEGQAHRVPILVRDSNFEVILKDPRAYHFPDSTRIGGMTIVGHHAGANEKNGQIQVYFPQKDGTIKWENVAVGGHFDIASGRQNGKVVISVVYVKDGNAYIRSKTVEISSPGPEPTPPPPPPIEGDSFLFRGSNVTVTVTDAKVEFATISPAVAAELAAAVKRVACCL